MGQLIRGFESHPFRHVLPEYSSVTRWVNSHQSLTTEPRVWHFTWERFDALTLDQIECPSASDIGGPGFPARPCGRAVGLALWPLASYCFARSKTSNMRRVLQTAALTVTLGAIVLWLFSGANQGWTKTGGPRTSLGDLTGAEVVTEEKRFVPGLDFLWGAIMTGIVLAGASLLFPNRPNSGSGPPTKTP